MLALIIYHAFIYSVKSHAIKILNFILKLKRSHCARTDYIVCKTSKLQYIVCKTSKLQYMAFDKTLTLLLPSFATNDERSLIKKTLSIRVRILSFLILT